MFVLECGIFSSMHSKNIKVTFENQDMVSQVLIKGLVLFNFSHPAHNICREIFVYILTCFKCYQIESHPTSSCPKSKEYKIFPAFGSVSTVKKRETIIAPLL